MANLKKWDRELTIGFVVLLVVCFLPFSAEAADIWTLTFESEGGYTPLASEFTDGAGDYFTRSDGTNITGSFWDFTSLQGSWAFVAQDIDGDTTVIPQYFTAEDINISGYTDLWFAVYIAEDDAGDALEDWDGGDDYLKIQYSIDGGGWTDLVWVSPAVLASNQLPAIDADFDGTGESTTITDNFTEFYKSIAGTGNTIDIRVTVSLNSGDEDIAIDNLRIYGTSSYTPIAFTRTEVAAGPLRHGVADSCTVMAGYLDTGPRILEAAIHKASGSAENADIPSLTLWHDIDTSGLYSSGDVRVGSLPWDADNSCYFMSGSTWDQTASGEWRFVVTASIADTATITDNQDIRFQFSADSGFLIDRDPSTVNDDVRVPGSLQANTALKTVNDEIADEELTVTKATSDTVYPGDTKLVLTLGFPSDAGVAYTLNDIHLEAAGTLVPTTDYTVRLWHDDGDATYEADQDTAYDLTWDGGNSWWEDSGGDMGIGIGAGGESLFVTVCLTGAGSVNEGVILTIPSGSTSFTTDPLIVTNITSDISSNIVSIGPKLLINEHIQTSTNAGAEYLELFNPSPTQTIQLNSATDTWIIGDGENNAEFTFPSGHTIAPLGYYLLCRSATDFAIDFPEAPKPNAEWDTGLSGDSASIPDVLYLPGATNTMSLGSSDEVYLTKSIGSENSVEIVGWGTITPGDLPEGSWTGTASPSGNGTASAVRSPNGKEGAEPSGANSEDLASVFVASGRHTPGTPNAYVGIPDGIVPGTNEAGNTYITVGFYDPNGDTQTSADTNIVVTVAADHDNSCTFSDVQHGSLVVGNNTRKITITTSGGYARFKISDICSEDTTVYVTAPGVGSFMHWYDTQTVSLSQSAKVVINEVSPADDPVDWVELYVVTGGAHLPSGFKFSAGGAGQGATQFGGLEGLTAGDYIMVWDMATTNISDTNAKNANTYNSACPGADTYWDVYIGAFGLNNNTEDAVKLLDGSGGIIDAVCFGPGEQVDGVGAMSVADIELIWPIIDAGQWSQEGDTLTGDDLVVWNDFNGKTMGRDSSSTDTNSKYGWSANMTATPGSANGADFQDDAGYGLAYADPRYVYPGAENVKLTFTFVNNVSGVGAVNNAYLALEAPAGYPAFNLGNDSGTVRSKCQNGSDYDSIVIKSSTLAYMEMGTTFNDGDTIAFTFANDTDDGGGMVMPTGTGADAFLLKADMDGSAVKTVDTGGAYTTVNRVYPDDLAFSPASPLASLWGTVDTITITATYSGNNVAGCSGAVLITSNLDGGNHGADGTKVYYDGTVYSTHWQNIPITFNMSGSAVLGMITDGNDTGSNSIMVTVRNGAATSYAETFADVTICPDVLFNEIMYDPPAGDANEDLGGGHGEFIELVNTTGGAIDLENWQIWELNTGIFTFPAVTLPAYGYVVVTEDNSATGLLYEGFCYDLEGVTVVEWDGMQLNNADAGADEPFIALWNATGDTRDVIRNYQDIGAGGDSNTVQKNKPSAGSNDLGNWAANGMMNGTPGHLNSNALSNDYSRIAATGTLADSDGVDADSAQVKVTVMTADQNPVPNHGVTVYFSSGNANISPAVGLTNDQGQFTAYCTSTVAAVVTAKFDVSAETYNVAGAGDSIQCSASATVRFYADGGDNILFGDPAYSAISSVDTDFCEAGSATGYAGHYAMPFANWAADGSALCALEGDFDTVTGSPADASDRFIYSINPGSGAKTQLSHADLSPCPYGNATIADIDGDGGNEVVFSGYVTAYDGAFWGLWMLDADGSQSGIDKTNFEGHHISPEQNYTETWTPDAIDHADGIAIDATYKYNVACSVGGDIVIFSGKKMAEHAYTYGSRSRNNDWMARVLSGYYTYRWGDGATVAGSEKFAYYWIEPTWSPDGSNLALTRVDLRNLGDGGATVFQSEIWVMRDVASRLSGDTNARGNYMVRVSDATIDGTATGDADANPGGGTNADTFYMNPQWSRDGKVISYAVETNGAFDFMAYLDDPNAAMGSCNFDVVMRYVGSFTVGTDMAAIGGDASNGYYVTWPEEMVMGGAANELSMSWSPAGAAAATINGIRWDNTSTSLAKYELTSEAQITTNGGILFDDGMVTAVVAADDDSAAGTVIRVSAPTESLDDAADTMFTTGAAREFWPSGWTSASDVQVILHYDAADLLAAGIADGDPEELLLKVYWWNGSSWADYGGVVNPDDNTITFFTNHFSTYAIFLPRDPSAATSTLTIDKTTVLADGLDGAVLTATVKDDTGDPIPNLPVRFETDRGDSIYNIENVTNGDGVMRVYVKSSESGTAVVRCTNLDSIFTETFAVNFMAARSHEGLVLGELDGIMLYVPAGAFDTDVGFTITMPDGSYSAMLNNAALKVDNNSRAEFTFLASKPEYAANDITGELHAWRASDGASMDTALQMPIFLLADLPESVLLATGGSPVLLWLDEDNQEWVPLDTEYDAEHQWARAPLEHLSIYRLGLSAVGVTTLNDVIIYPNPWRADRHANNANRGIKMLLPVNRNLEIKIYTIAGDLVDAQQISTAGGVNSFSYVWDLQNSHGRVVASGVYFIVIKDTASGETTVKTAAVIQ